MSRDLSAYEHAPAYTRGPIFVIDFVRSDGEIGQGEMVEVFASGKHLCNVNEADASELLRHLNTTLALAAAVAST